MQSSLVLISMYEKFATISNSSQRLFPIQEKKKTPYSFCLKVELKSHPIDAYKASTVSFCFKKSSDSINIVVTHQVSQYLGNFSDIPRFYHWSKQMVCCILCPLHGTLGASSPKHNSLISLKEKKNYHNTQ